jgi:cytochrome P450
MMFYQIDFLIKMAFTETAGTLEKGEDTMGIMHLGHERFSHWTVWQPLPYVERFIYQNPLWNRVTRQPTRWSTMSVEKMEARLASKVPQEPKDLLQKYLDASEKSDIIQKDTIVRLVNSTISASVDTTAMTMTGILYFLMKNPRTLVHLRKEIEDAVTAGQLSFPCRFQDVNRLPYLGAVIKETQRINLMITIPLERVVPAKGAVIAGKFIPAGTVVGCSSTVLHRNRTIYGEDVDEFRLERWLTNDEDRKSAMERTFIGLGAGSRVCLGRHIATLEIKVIPTIVAKFEARPVRVMYWHLLTLL